MTDVAAAGMWDAAPRSRRRLRTRSGSGDIESLYRQLSPQVLGYLRAHGTPDPENVLGEVFYEVARDSEQFSGSGSDLRRWVFAIARNRMIDAFRRGSVRPSIADGEPPDTGVADLGATALDEELVAALAAVTDEQREVVVLRFIADLSIRDVAAVTGRDVGAVKALQQRGLAALRRALDALAGEQAAGE